jgi:circadian clock protein KaiB
MRVRAGVRSKKSSANGHGRYMELRLYVAGQSPKSLAALANLKKFCAEHLDGQYELQVIDLVRHRN